MSEGLGKKRKGEENLEIVEIEDVTNFTNRMQKSRAMKKLKRALPQTPRKKAELLINLLTGKKSKQSPTMAKLRQMNIVKSPDEIENDEIAKHVLVDVKKVLTHTKAQRSKDSLVTKHIILAAVSGESVTENRCKKKLASKLEVPIRRLSGDDDFEVVDMIRKGSLVALYTDDEGEDFYLMKAGSCQEKLKSSETDDWQGQYPEGTTVIRGLYYRKTGPLSYSLIKRKNVIVSVKSVLYVTNDILTDSVIDLSLAIHEEIIGLAEQSSL
ncbi:unnamed protein product [Mytilus edulis]|uniref:Uncharacterized protein n=1 Tax=Mytilus edulis TaxID=6550 RepID=A0A8S3QC66_MYTED|nr:unnamed protein product [Mytilus edulis]